MHGDAGPSSSANSHPHALFGSLFSSDQAGSLAGGPEGYQAALQAAQVREAILRIELRSIESHWEKEHGERRKESCHCMQFALLFTPVTSNPVSFTLVHVRHEPLT